MIMIGGEERHRESFELVDLKDGRRAVRGVSRRDIEVVGIERDGGNGRDLLRHDLGRASFDGRERSNRVRCRASEEDLARRGIEHEGGHLRGGVERCDDDRLA
jgi:hypothetical protein